MIDWNRWQHYQQAVTSWQWGLIVVGISAAIWVIVQLRAYFREDAEDSDGTLEMLTQFRDLHQEGGLSDDEFRLIRSRLARSAREALVAEKAIPSAILAEMGPTDLLGPNNDHSNDAPAIHSTIVNEVTSTRIADEETE